MGAPEPISPRLSRTPWIVLGASTLFVVLAAIATISFFRVREAAATDRAVEEAIERVERRMDAYITTLRGAAGLFAAAGEVDRAAFRRFVERQRIGLLPGIQGIGWSRRFTSDAEWQRASTDARAAGLELPSRPADRSEWHAILYLEPLDARNRAAIGFDMSSEPVRREAMEHARDVGLAASSARVRLVQEIDEDVQPGFLIYVPVYRDVVFPRTLEERRRLLVGYVYAPFRAHDLFGAAIGRPRDMRVEIFDAADTSPDALLYASDQGSPDRAVVERIEIAARTWTVRVTPHGPPIPLSTIAGVAIGAVGLVLSMLLFAAVRREVVARREAQIALEIEARNAQLRETFMGVLGHDLRNPLGAIVMGAKALRGRSDVTDAQRPILDRIVSSGERAIRMVSQLLDLTRARVGGGIPLQRQRVELLPLVRDAVDELQRARGRAIEVDVAPALWVDVDPDRIAQVLSNLLGNALTHGPPGTPVRIAARRDGGSAHIEVVNHGGPIPPEVARSLFDPFVRGEGARRTSEGLGLGLYISEQIVVAHGGTLVLREPRADEVAFVITLPAPPRR